MIDIRTGREMTRGGFLKGILAAGVAPAIVGLAGSANGGVGRGMMRGVGARMAALEGDSLPYDERLEYLESNGKQYIDTELMITPSRDVVDLDFARVTYTAEWAQIAGINGGSGNLYLLREYNNMPEYLNFVTTSQTGSVVNMNNAYTDENFITLHCESGNIRLGSTTKAILLMDAELPYTFCLFAAKAKGGVLPVTKSRIKRFRKTGGDSSCSMIPVLKNGIPCMYDEIRDRFFYNLKEGHQFGYKQYGKDPVSPY